MRQLTSSQARRAIGLATFLSAPVYLGGCPQDTNTDVNGQQIASNGLNCWDTNGNGLPDTAEDLNGDGRFDSADCAGADGAAGAEGAVGAAGATGPQGLAGLNGTNGANGMDGAAGAQGLPGTVDITIPTTAASLLLKSSRLGAPEYELTWEYAGSSPALSHFNVYVSDQSITSGHQAAALWTSVSASERSANVLIYPDRGMQYFRVSAVSYTGVESALSAEVVIDTTSRVVFAMDNTVDGRLDLYTGSPTGAGLTLISGTIVSGGSVSSTGIQPSPDGRRCAFLADADTDNVTELYVVDLSTNVRTKINPNLSAGSYVWSYVWSPDGSKIAYLADSNNAGVFEAFVAPATGGASTRVSPSLVSGGDATSLKWSPNGKYLAIYGDFETDAVYEVFVADAQGTAVAKVSGTRDSTHGVEHYRWSPDSEQIAFSAYDGGMTQSLHVVDRDGSNLAACSGPTLDLIGYYFRWSPDSTRIAYCADIDGSGIRRLLTISPDGSNQIDVTGTIVTGGDVTWFAWSPDGNWLAVTGDIDTDQVGELYLVSPGGGGIAKLSGTLVTDGTVGGFDFHWSPDSRRISFWGDRVADNVFENYTVGLDGAPPIAINGTLVSGGDSTSYSHFWSPDGTRILFRADKSVDGMTELFCVSPLGGAVTKINGSLGATADVDAAYWATFGYEDAGL